MNNYNDIIDKILEIVDEDKKQPNFILRNDLNNLLHDEINCKIKDAYEDGYTDGITAAEGDYL